MNAQNKSIYFLSKPESKITFMNNTFSILLQIGKKQAVGVWTSQESAHRDYLETKSQCNLKMSQKRQNLHGEQAN